MTTNCPHCGQRIKLGQSPLTTEEKKRYDWGGPNDKVNIVKARSVKAAAEYYGVVDWMTYWDTDLSVSENIDIMCKHGTADIGGPTLREMPERIQQ